MNIAAVYVHPRAKVQVAASNLRARGWQIPAVQTGKHIRAFPEKRERMVWWPKAIANFNNGE